MGLRTWVLGMVVGLGAWGVPSHLNENQIQQIENILSNEPINLEQAEMNYQTLVQQQIFSDLLLLYSPENESKLKITYASFSREDFPGEDDGFGLHVVKRLHLPQEDGSEKVIDVNEHWGANVMDRGLYLPDEIRVKTLVFHGERHTPGSQKNYLFDSFRLAWGKTNSDLSFCRRTSYTYNAQTHSNETKTMRVPVSAPFDCMSCHQAHNSFARKFASVGVPINHEAIVQDSYFDMPIEQTHGYVDYAHYLQSGMQSKQFVKATLDEIRNPKKAMRVPNLLSALKSAVDHPYFCWLSEDSEPNIQNIILAGHRRGAYHRNGVLLLDALEASMDELHWWYPNSVIPNSYSRYSISHQQQ